MERLMETRGEENGKRILRRSVEVYGEDSKGSEVNVLCIPERRSAQLASDLPKQNSPSGRDECHRKFTRWLIEDKRWPTLARF